jgi:glycerol-3-phosphate dehydrogenase
MNIHNNGNRLAALKDQQFDIAVVGGGIIGAGIARDAAMRGLRVALFEKDDYGSGTSSRSTRLIHGGLRYLEMLDFALVRMDLKERETLLHIAPHLVRPLPFLVPFYSKSLFYRAKLRIGMYLYDWLSFDKSLPNHKYYSTKETLKLEPALQSEGLQGAFIYYDGQVALVERLTMENILSAQQHGAQCFNHASVQGLVKQGNKVVGLRVRDELAETDQSPVEVEARLVINAAGAWLDGVEQQLTGQPSHRVRRTKGIHFTAPAAVNNAIVLFAEDNRLFFVIPWLGYAWVGTTDTDFEGELEKVRADHDDVEYLLEVVRKIFPKADWDKIYYTNAGVRALVRKGHNSDKDESAVSRKHALIDHAVQGDAPGLLSVVGGKITGYRGIAEDAVNLAAKKLGLKTPTSTAKTLLPGGTVSPLEDFTTRFQAEAAELGLSQAQATHLINLYGSRAREVLTLVQADPTLAQPLHPAYPVLRAQVKLAVEQEQCLTLCDFMMRRSDLYFTPDQGRQAAPVVSAELTTLLGWSEPRCQQEEAAYAQVLAWTQEWKQDLTPAAASELVTTR